MSELPGFRSPLPPTRGERVQFAYGASLRIFGTIPNLDEITQTLGITPTHTHRKGELRRPDAPPHRQDMWVFTAPVDPAEPLYHHIDELWVTFKRHKDYLLQLKQNMSVDVFLEYHSNCEHAGLEIPYESQEMFRELELPFGLSIVVSSAFGADPVRIA